MLSLHESLGRFGIRPDARVEPLDGGFANRNHLVHDGDRCFVLRVAVGRSRQALTEEFGLLERVRRAGVPAPGVVRSADGDAVVDTLDGPAALMTWIDGTHPQGTPLTCTRLGALLSQLHSVPHADLATPDRWLSAAWRRSAVDRLAPHADARVRAVTTRLAALDTSRLASLPHAITHGDVHDGNLIEQDDGTLVLLDWEEAAVAPAVLDVASALLWFGFDGTRPRPDAARSLLHGYQHARPLESAESDALATALPLVACSVVLWCLDRELDVGDLTIESIPVDILGLPRLPFEALLDSI